MLESFSYAINLNEIGYIGLFFLTEKIYRRRFTSGKAQRWVNLILKILSNKNQKEAQN